MKIEKLRMVRDELIDEVDTADGKCIIYYNFNNLWHELDSSTALSNTTRTNLNKTKTNNSPVRVRKQSTVFFPFMDIECVIGINFSSAQKPADMERYNSRLQKVIKRALNAYKVSHNQLTQLLSRDTFRENLKVQLQATVKAVVASDEMPSGQNEIHAVLALDIDNFKQVNDTYGHLYGDQVLKTFAIRLEKTARDIQIYASKEVNIFLGHPSGEEFFISIHGGESQDEILTWADMFRKSIFEYPLPTDVEWGELNSIGTLSPILLPQIAERTVTTSIGVAFCNPSEDISANQITSLLDDADTALYRAKAAGRNQVIAFDDILNSCGRVLEHETNTRIIAIDIGKNVGVSLGQEFKIYAPGFDGRRKFSMNDGRTVRTLGNYPRVELTTITVFDVQPELAFAYISDTDDTSTIVEVGATLEAIPAGSIGHLLTSASRYFPNAMDYMAFGDSSKLQEFIKNTANTSAQPYAVVFHLSGQQDYLRRFGNAGLNSALALLFREIRGGFPSADAIGILDTSSICMVGKNSTYDEEILKKISMDLRRQLVELQLLVGVFCQADVTVKANSNNEKLDAANAIEFARYAASELAHENKNMVVHFNYQTAQQILDSLRNAKAYKQGIADFERMRQLGVSGDKLFNLGGLCYGATKDYRKAAEMYAAAAKLGNTVVAYKTNFAVATFELLEIERGLALTNTLTDAEVDKAMESYPWGFIAYTALLAKAKIDGLPSSNPQRFKMMAPKALALPQAKNNYRSKIIRDALPA